MIISCPRPTTTVDEGEVATTQIKLDITRSALWSHKTCMNMENAGEDQLQPMAATTLKVSTLQLVVP